MEDKVAIQNMLKGYRATILISVAVKTGIIEQLAVNPGHIAALSDFLTIPASTLHRMLRGLSLFGLCEEQEKNRFRLTAKGELLRKHSNSGLYDEAILCMEQYLPAWQEFEYSLMTGKPAFDHHFDQSVWEHRKQNSQINNAFVNWLSITSIEEAKSIVVSYDFSKAKVIADIGGGRGELMVEILSSYPVLSGVILEQSHIVKGAQAYLTEQGLSARCEVVACDFFEAISTQADLFLLKSVIHDWEDEMAIKILKNCCKTLPRKGKLLLIERKIPDIGRDNPEAVMLDLHMLIVTGGRERTEGEYLALLSHAGFEQAHAYHTAHNYLLIEAHCNIQDRA